MDSSHHQKAPFENNSSINNQPKKVKGKGRQKIKLEKIENGTNLQVTFSKRRSGLFKKASELSTLCGADSAIVVFSPSNKVHSYGNPNVETITNMFLNQIVLSRTEYSQRIVARDDAIMRQCNQELTNLESKLEVEKKRRKDNKHRSAPINLDEFIHQELDELNKSILGFKQDYEYKVKTATRFANSYIQESNPDEEIGGGFPVMTPGAGFPLDPNVQGHNYMFDLYGNKQAMLTNEAPLDHGGGNSNIAIPNNPGAKYNPTSAIFFSNPGFFYPLNPMADNFGLTFQYPHGASSSNIMFPFNYGNPKDIMSFDAGTSTNIAGNIPRATQSYVQDKSDD